MRTPSVARAYPLRGANARPSESSAAPRNFCAASSSSPRTPDLDDGTRLNSEPAEEQWVEAEAFSSVHDLVHHAILSQPGSCASLRQIYDTCEKQGRIAYKRSGGSRNITANEHWKSQIRHALYTSARFCRAPSNDDCWSVARGHTEKPATTTVRIDLSAQTTTPASSRQGTPGPNTASGKKRARSTPISGNKSKPKQALGGAHVSESATPASSSATSSASGGGFGFTSPRSARARPASVPNLRTTTRNTTNTSQYMTPEPQTPDLSSTASLDTAGILSALAYAAQHQHNNNNNNNSHSKLIPPDGAPPKKRLKAAAAAAAAAAMAAAAGAFHDSASKAASNADSDELHDREEEMEDDEPKVMSLRDTSRNRRKPPKTPVAVFVPAPEPAPPPRDVTRNRRKGKAEKAPEGQNDTPRGSVERVPVAPVVAKGGAKVVAKGGANGAKGLAKGKGACSISVSSKPTLTSKPRSTRAGTAAGVSAVTDENDATVDHLEGEVKEEGKPMVNGIRTGPVSQRELKYDTHPAV